MQFFVIALFLMLGTLLVIYIDNTPGLDIPEKSDEIFGLVVSHPSLPVITGVLFITGLVAAAYSAAGSALVSLTTSFTVDILDGTGMEDTLLLIHISEPTRQAEISDAVLCLKKKKMSVIYDGKH